MTNTAVVVAAVAVVGYDDAAAAMQLCGDEQTGGGGGGDGGFVVMNRRIGVTVDAVGPVAVEEVHPNILCRSQLGILQVTDIRREERR